MNHWKEIALLIFWVWNTFVSTTIICAQSDGPKASSLNWVRLQGAESCITSQKLAREIEKLLGCPVFVSAVDADLSIEGFVSGLANSKGWRARVVVSDAKGTILGSREVRTDESNCSELNDPLVLVIALSIDPEAAFVQLPQQLSPNESDAIDPAADLLSELKSEKKPPKATKDPLINAKKPTTTSSNLPKKNEKVPDTRDWRFWVDAGIAGGAGFLPGISTGFLLQFYMDLPWVWPLQINLLYWMKSETESKMDGRGELQAMQGLISICPLSFDFSVGKWIVCGGGQLSVEEANSIGFEKSNDQTYWQFSIEVSSRFYLPVTELFGLSLGADLMVPIPRHRYQIRIPEEDSPGDNLTLYETSPVAGRAEIAAGVHF